MATFLIYDDSKGVFEDDTLVEASTNRKAVEKYLVDTCRGNVPIKPGTGYSLNICSTKVVLRDGRMYRSGRKSWWTKGPKVVDEV